jgi:hypothetical protein
MEEVLGRLIAVNKIASASHSCYIHRRHEDCSSRYYRLAIDALESVIASLLFLPTRRL